MNITSRISLALALCMALLLGACSTLLGPRTLHLSVADLQTALANRLPLDNRYLGLFDVRLTNPQLSLQDGRLRIALDAGVRPLLAQNSWNGSFAVSGVPRIDAGKRSLMLGQIRVDNLNVNGLAPAYSSQLGRLGSALAELFITDLPIYTFKATDFSYAGMQFMPSALNTASNGLVITFEPTR